MHKGKGMRRMAVRLDMTPMVDIAFLLLIFYMATTQFKPPEARAVELPGSHSRIELPERDVVNVTITREDSILVDWIEPGGIRRVVHTAPDGVVEAIQQGQAARIKLSGEAPLVVVKADHRVKYGLFDRVVSAMQAENLARFLIITDPESEAEDVWLRSYVKSK